MRRDDGTVLVFFGLGAMTLGAAASRQGAQNRRIDTLGLDLTDVERGQILAVARRAGLPMPDESSGEVAIAIQDVLLGGRGQLIAGVNAAEWAYSERPYGAVGVLHDGTFWTAHGGEPWTRETQEIFLDGARFRGVVHNLDHAPKKHQARRLRRAAGETTLLKVDRDWLARYGLLYTQPSPYELLYDLRNRVLSGARSGAPRPTAS